jgi:hypothetical protein
MDIEMIKPFDELLNNNYMIAYENNENKDVEAGCFGSVKESLYIKECLDYIKIINLRWKYIKTATLSLV